MNKQHQSTAMILRSLWTIWKHVAECVYGSTHFQKKKKLRWVVSFRPRPHIPLGKSLRYVLSRSGPFCRREISTVNDTQPRFFSRPAHKIVTTTDWRSKMIISTWNRANVGRTVCTGHLTSTPCWMYVSFPYSTAFYFICVISATQSESNSSSWISSVSHAPATAVSRGCLRYLKLAGMPVHPSELVSGRAETIRRHVTTLHVYC